MNGKVKNPLFECDACGFHEVDTIVNGRLNCSMCAADLANEPPDDSEFTISSVERTASVVRKIFNQLGAASAKGVADTASISFTLRRTRLGTTVVQELSNGISRINQFLHVGALLDFRLRLVAADSAGTAASSSAPILLVVCTIGPKDYVVAEFSATTLYIGPRPSSPAILKLLPPPASATPTPAPSYPMPKLVSPSQFVITADQESKAKKSASNTNTNTNNSNNNNNNNNNTTTTTTTTTTTSSSNNSNNNNNNNKTTTSSPVGPVDDDDDDYDDDDEDDYDEDGYAYGYDEDDDHDHQYCEHHQHLHRHGGGPRRTLLQQQQQRGNDDGTRKQRRDNRRRANAEFKKRAGDAKAPEIAAEFKQAAPVVVKKEVVVELPPFKAPCMRDGCAHPWVYGDDVFYELVCTEQVNDDVPADQCDSGDYHVSRCHKSCLDALEASRGKDEFGNTRCPRDSCAGVLRMRVYVRINDKRVRDVRSRDILKVVTAEDLRREAEEKARAAEEKARAAERLAAEQAAAKVARERDSAEQSARRQREQAEQTERKNREALMQAERKRISQQEKTFTVAEKAMADKASERAAAMAAADARRASAAPVNEFGELVDSNKARKRAERERWKANKAAQEAKAKGDFYLPPSMVPGGEPAKIVKESPAAAAATPAPAPAPKLTEEEHLRLARGEFEGQFLRKDAHSGVTGFGAKPKRNKNKGARGGASASASGAASGARAGASDKATQVLVALADEDIDASVEMCTDALEEVAGNVSMAIDLVRRRIVLRAAGIVEDPRSADDVFRVLQDEGWNVSLERCKALYLRYGGNADAALRELRREEGAKLNAADEATAASNGANAKADVADGDTGGDEDDKMRLLALIAKKVAQTRTTLSGGAADAAPPAAATPAPPATGAPKSPPAQAPTTLFDELDRAQREQEMALERFQMARKPATPPPNSSSGSDETERALAEQQQMYQLFAGGNGVAPIASANGAVGGGFASALFGTSLAPMSADSAAALGGDAAPVFGVVRAASSGVTIGVPIGAHDDDDDGMPPSVAVAAAASVIDDDAEPTAPTAPTTPAAPRAPATYASVSAQLRASLGAHFSPDDLETEVAQWRSRQPLEVPEWDVVALSLIEKEHHTMLQCIVCEDRLVSIKIVQCEHAVLCGVCLTSLIEMAERRKMAEVKCPLCRGPLVNVSNVVQPLKSDAERMHERAVLLTALNMPQRVSAAVRLASSGFSLQLCLLAVSEAKDNVPAAAIWLQQRAPHYIRIDNMLALEKVVDSEVARELGAADALVGDDDAGTDDHADESSLFAAQF